MELYLMQHGLAEPEEADPARPLTPQGRAEVELVTAAAAAAGVALDEVWRSDKLRAIQTAEILARGLAGAREPQARPGLDPGADVLPIANLLRDAPFGQRIAIVGHLPFLDRLASLLVCGTPAGRAVAFRNAGLVKLVPKRVGDHADMAVAWVLTPDCLPH